MVVLHFVCIFAIVSVDLLSLQVTISQFRFVNNPRMEFVISEQ